MATLCGFHHVGLLTTDMDRLLDFYKQVFDASAVFDATEDDVRSALIDVGGGAFLHAFMVPDEQVPPADRPKYHRGRLDHFALNTPTRKIFLEVRRRAMEAGASDGRVRAFGAMQAFKFRDPDGLEGDVMWTNPDVPLSALRRYADAPWSDDPEQ